MSSSIMAGERRWASARRGGMTVLGKVAVPKPLNLPSQRLENHGLDPNVEIVPKGSLNWGGRSSSASNPWGTSAVSPNTEDTVSPSHLSGRPSSSGGSGTRPSTAGNDRIHEVGGSAWGQNSRPSSASGRLISNQASLSRPHSAETRPGSSQLSRFAEPAADSSVAWGSTGTVEKLELNCKSDNFSLSSGDFPTLGKNPESEDNHSHGRPSSASGRVASPKERSHNDVKGGTMNTWTRDGAQHVEDGFHPSAQQWHEEHPQYFNSNMPPQHFDAWRGPPMNHPPGVWYRGPPGGPPYPPVPHGGFPVEPFPYYRPHIPPALANPQPVPPRGPGPRSHYPKNGDFYRPQMPDAYMRPGMPVRPGFYPGPMPYDGYYGPPMGFNPNERDIPFMGMPGAPPMYNMYPPQNPPEPGGPGDILVRVGGRGTGENALVSEHVGSGHSDDARRPVKVLKKRPNEWGLEEEESSGSTASATALLLEKGEQPRKTSVKNEWGADNRTDEELYSGRARHGESHSTGTSLGHQVQSPDSAILKSPRYKSKAVDESPRKVSEIASPFLEVPQVLQAESKDTSLIQKIDYLNAKVRDFNGREDVVHSSVREEQMNRVQIVEKTSQVTADNVPTISRKPHGGMHGRMDHQHKGRFNNHDTDGWRKRIPSLVSESSASVPSVNHVTVEATDKSEVRTWGKNEEGLLAPIVEPIDGQAQNRVTGEAAEKSGIRAKGKNEEESSTPTFETIDGQAQKAKMRELAKQRAIQLQKEEEERIREQKAKALAKLEELNRRTLAGDTSTQKDSAESNKQPGTAVDADKHVTEPVEKPLTGSAIQLDLEKSQKHLSSVIDADKHAAQKLAKSVPNTQVPSSFPPNTQVLAQTSAGSTGGERESFALSRSLPFEVPNETNQEPSVLHSQFVPSKVDVVHTSSEDSKAPNDVSLRKNKRNKQKQSIHVESVASDKQKQRIQGDLMVTEKASPISKSEVQIVHDGGPSEIVASQIDPASVLSSNIMQESVGQNRRKNSRNNRNKHKQDDAAASNSVSQPPVQKEALPAKPFVSTALKSPVQNENFPASQPSVWKETRPAKSSATATSQPLIPKETSQKESIPAKASSTNISQLSAQKESISAMASAAANLERGQPKASQIERDSNSAKLVTDVKDANQQPNSKQNSSLPSEEAYSRVNNQWKPQNSRRMPRNPQAPRSGDNFHSSESVVWAPVRSQNKLEPEGGDRQKVESDATPAEVRNDNPVQSSVKSKRAELERYVPKPVAKELSQQGSIQQPVALSSSTPILDDTSQREGPGFQSIKPEVGDGRSSLDPRHGDFKQSKPIRNHGSWRQRGPSEAYDKGFQPTSAPTSNPSKNAQKSMNQQDTKKVDSNFVPSENKGFHDWDPSDGWSMPEEPNATATAKTTALMKDESVRTGNGRRQTQKVHRSNVNSHDNDYRGNSSGGEADKSHIHSAAMDISQSEGIASSREGRGSHWQPKSQAKSASNQRGSRYGQGQKDNYEQFGSENKNIDEGSNTKPEGGRREIRSDSSKRRPRTPNQSLGPYDYVEERAADQHYSGSGRGGIQNIPGSGRGYDSRRDWAAVGHENKPQHVGHSRDRQRQNTQFENKTVDGKFNNFDGDGSRNMGPRYRERVSGRPRRGACNFHGNIQVEAGNNYLK